MNLNTFLAAIGRYWKTFVVVSGLMLALGLGWILLTPAKFVSTTQLLVSISGSTTATAYQNDEVVAGRINSYIPLLTSGAVTQRVIDKLGLPLTSSDLAAEISATNVPPKTSIIDVAVTDESPERARLIADTLAREFVGYTTALETPTGEDDQKVRTTVVTTAGEPQEHRAELFVLGVLAALTALLLGAVAVWIRSVIDPVVRTADRVASAAGVPVLGRVTATPAESTDDIEGYRRLQTPLRSMVDTGGGRVLGIVSLDSEIDATLVASNLARAMALGGSRSIVVDAGILPTAETEPLQDIRLEPKRGADGYPDTLSVIRWGAEPGRTASESAALIDSLRGDYDEIIIAAAPMLATTTAPAVGEYADAVLLVVAAETTKRREVGRAAENLKEMGAPLIGAVIVDKDGNGAQTVGSEQ